MITHLRTFLQSSAWAPLAGRAFLIAIALVVLAAIGHHNARAAPPISPLPPVPIPVPIPEKSAAAPPPPPTPPTAPPATGRASADSPVYINQAGAEDLRRLPGVGAKRAQAILDLRARVGRFHRVEDLLRVKGVGRKTLQKWRPLIRLDPPDAGRP